MSTLPLRSIENLLFEKVSARTELIVRIVASGLLGYVSWQNAFFPLLLIFFGLFIVYTRSVFITWASACSYYATSSSDLPQAFVNFFPDSFFGYGYVLWFLSAMIIALPWAVARYLADLKLLNNLGDFRFAIATFLGMVISLLPPISFIHWVHPGLVSGLLFPGLGLLGLVLTFVIISFFPLTIYYFKKWVFVSSFSTILGLVTYQLATYSQPIFAPNVTSVSTDDGAFDPLDSYKKIKLVKSVASDAIDMKVPLVVFPETYLGRERDSIHSLLASTSKDLEKNNITILVGMESKSKEGVYLDSLYGFGKEQGVVYSARLPMPLNGISHNGNRESFNIFESPVKTIAGQNIFFSICYEGYLLEHLLSAFLSDKKPDVMVASSNLWALKGLNLANIQGITILMMSRILGVPLEWAKNK